MASLLKNIAEPYDKDKVYNTKDMVLYNNLLYLCIYNNVSGEFDTSKWIEVQLTDLVQGKLRGIEDYSGKVIDASYVEEDDDYIYFGVPQKAFVDNETSFRTLSSNLKKIESSYKFIDKRSFNYQSSNVTFTSEVGKIYEIINYGYQGSQTLELSNFTGCDVIKNIIADSSIVSAGFVIAFVKATSTTITFTATASNNIGVVLECTEKEISGIDKISTVVSREANIGPCIKTVTKPTNKQCIVLLVGYQGGLKNVGITEGIELVSLSNASGYNDYGISQLIAEATDDFDVVLSTANGHFLITLN